MLAWHGSVSPDSGAGLGSQQTRGFLSRLINMRELTNCWIQVNVLRIWVPCIDIGSVSNSRKDFLEPDLIENNSEESIAKTDLEN